MSTQTDEVRRVSAIYDRLAPDWDARQGLVERRLMGSAMRQALGRKLYGDVLEIGTGTGATLPYVMFGDNAVTSFTGTDISSAMLDKARKQADARPNIHFNLMQADALAFPDASFDVVTTSLVLCTVPDPEAALREMSRVCKPGGRIVVLEHVRAPNPLLAWIQKKLTPLQVRAMGCHFDRPTDQTMRDLGFTIEAEQRRYFGVFLLLTARPIADGGGAASPTTAR
jgi:ubiquinone/menaquinone biosynthesis C-methylase UbiE